MGAKTRSHAISLTVSVVLSSVSVGMLFFAMMSSTAIKPFLIAASACIIAAVTFNVILIVKTENDKHDQHDKLKDISPKFCPDYWTNMYSPCDGQTCKPTFDEPDKTVIMSSSQPRDVGTPISNIGVGLNGDGVCETRGTRAYPWTELDNACDSRERTP